MRIRYVGSDGRTRIAEITRVKFMHDGWTTRDKRNEVDEDIKGPLVVVYQPSGKGGKRLIMLAPDEFDMNAAKIHLLEKGWLDLSSCQMKVESFY
ncbi:MAG: hypothetical protein LBJ21_06145 [Acidobacteriota bacterium]|jgi:hypothetical protein|nr:hypothetical protein [Acidobacteriota bacterium]